ncbi:MAG: lysophospholipid acyltransferase family protein [Hyphomicrobiaceae bacterium]
MNMLRSIVFAVVFYLNSAVFLIVGSPLLFAPRRWAMMGLKAHGLASLWWLKVICGTRMEVRGRENLPAGGALIVAKHQSAWDTFALIPLFRDPAMVMKAELMLIPFYGWFSYKFKHIFVERKRGPMALRKMVRDAKDRLQANREIVIFPEGSRTPPGAPPNYKSGVVALYEGLDVACIPVALNSGLYWPRRQTARHPGTIIIEILPALPAGLDRKTFRTTIEQSIETATANLIAEAAASETPPPTAKQLAKNA